MENLEIKPLSEYALNETLVTHINTLLLQLTTRAKPMTLADLETINAQEHVITLLASHEDKIIGMSNGVIAKTPLRKIMFVEETVVAEEYRGKGIGKMLTEKLIEIARSQEVQEVDLTSNPKRTIAIALYKSLGFNQRETNVYRLHIDG